MDDLTFLFTDLQDSTLMYERVGDATAYDLVRVHFRVLEGATREQGGVIVKTIGDAIMARFLEPTQAVHTALHMQERIDALAKDGGADLVLRIGLHRGPAIAVVVRDRVDYFGQTVNAASRIQAAAAPGEIVLSDDVYRGVGVAELLLGYDLVAERRSCAASPGRCSSTAWPRVRATSTPQTSRRRRPPRNPPARRRPGAVPGGIQDRPPRGVGRSAPLSVHGPSFLAPQRRTYDSGGARGRRAPRQARPARRWSPSYAAYL